MWSTVALDLVRDAKAGDEAAFGQLLAPLIQPAYRFACGMLHDREAAEDAVQESSLLAWRKLGKLHDGTDMRPWFFAIVANQCRTIRRGRWWSVLKREDLAETAQVGSGEPTGLDLRRALARLDPSKRAVVVLYFYLDLPLEEIAQVLGTTPTATKARLYRTVRELRGVLGSEEL
jgi:RNA polymerase sigma-70 factor (ECF subfamily)